MVRVQYQYPGDPVETADLMFGAEFKRFVRNGEPGFVRVINEDREDEISFSEVICDACNAEVLPQDPCAATADRLYCWSCAKEWVLAHLLHEQGVQVLIVKAR